MKRIWVFMAVLLGLAVLAQTGNQFATRYWRILNSQEYRFTWHYIPGKLMGFNKGGEPHGATLRTFVNNIAFDAIQAKTANTLLVLLWSKTTICLMEHWPPSP